MLRLSNQTHQRTETSELHEALVWQLVSPSRRGSLRIDKAALVFTEFGQITSFASPDQV